ncbi:MAG: SDR family NAD(P)-dependent oxidoreductase, partial [Miltoncostaeaceae bacterium]
RLGTLTEELGAPDRTLAVECDVQEWDQVEAMTAAALERFGRLDVVFANAGFGMTRGFTTGDPEEWRSMVLTNVYGAAITVRSTMPAVIAARGQFLLTGSVAGRKAVPGSLYSATKWAVSAIGESLRAELNGTGARVTLVEPGIVDTPFYDNGSPLPDPLTADDVARTIMFAVDQPAHVDINEILMRPTTQDM